MEFTPLETTGLYLIKPSRLEDERGYFSESFRQDKFDAEIGAGVTFVQDNVSHSKHKGTVRGLHYQSPPFAQGKLVRCMRGEIIDVAVDVRLGSATYGQHFKAILSESNGHQLWVPAGFLHGFATLVDDCEVAYKVTNFYHHESDGNVRWNDANLNIDWGIDSSKAILSDKDKAAPLFTDFKSPFSAA